MGDLPALPLPSPGRAATRDPSTGISAKVPGGPAPLVCCQLWGVSRQVSRQPYARIASFMVLCPLPVPGGAACRVRAAAAARRGKPHGACRKPARHRAGAQVGEDSEHAAVVVAARGQVEFAEIADATLYTQLARIERNRGGPET